MRTKLFLATLAAALLAVPAALANNGHLVRYSFLGQLTATPSNGGVSINVQSGNKIALLKYIKAPAPASALAQRSSIAITQSISTNFFRAR